MKKLLLSLCVIAGVVWLGGNVATGTNDEIIEVSIDYTDNPRHCYKEESFQEYQWKRIQNTPAVEEVSYQE